MTVETRYAQSGDIYIAYQAIGTGPTDLVFVPGFFSNIDHYWNHPEFSAFLKRLSGFCRLILFDKRGTGLSDRTVSIPSLEQRMDDVRAVMDDVKSQRATLFGISEGGAMSMLFAATYPERVNSLLLYSAYARFLDDVAPIERIEMFNAELPKRWGTGESLRDFAPEAYEDATAREWWGKFERLGASPSAAIALSRMNAAIDIRQILPTIRVPTLLLHRTGDTRIPISTSRYLRDNIPGAKLIELPGGNHAIWFGDLKRIADEIEVVVTGTLKTSEPDRVLATVVISDIVDSTKTAYHLGDAKWRAVLEEHDEISRREITRFRGRLIKSLGDGFLATFDGPARAVRCAEAIIEAIRSLGVELRVGIHAGEIELLDDDVAGIAVHITSRIASQAAAGQTLVSSAVKDIVAGSGLRFCNEGVHHLKGLEDAISLYAVQRD